METAYNIKRDLASFVAAKHGVTADYVRKVMRGDAGLRTPTANAIVDSYMAELEARERQLKHTTVSYNMNQRA